MIQLLRTCILFFSLQCICNPLFSVDESSSKPDQAQITTKKYHLSVCSIFKNEENILKEWIEYHKLVGVEHFYLYNNSSTDASLEVLKPYIEQGVATVIEWPDKQDSNVSENSPYRWVTLTQIPALEHACKELAPKETTWLAMIDVDEFILPKQSYTLTDLLTEYKDYGALVLMWHTYGTSDIPSISKNQLHIELLHKTCHKDHPFNKTVVKSIVKPEYFDGWRWPVHMPNLSNGLSHAFISGEQAHINHYISRSIDYVKNVKLKNKQHMDNRIYSEAEINELLTLGNDVEDTEKVIHRYLPELKKRMNITN